MNTFFPSQTAAPSYLIEAKSNFGQWRNVAYELTLAVAFHVAEKHALATHDIVRVRNRWTGTCYSVPKNACARVIIPEADGAIARIV